MRSPAAPGAGPLIVIPCLDEARHLPRLLHHFSAYCPDALIVIADGGSTDGTLAIADEFAASATNVRLMNNPRRLQSAAMNLAARRFGEGRHWIVRVDAHCRYPADYVQGLIAAAERTGADAVTVSMITLRRGGFQTAIAAAMNSRLGAGGSPHRRRGSGRFVEHGHHALIALDAFLQVGGYDECFSHNEDAEFDNRLIRHGFRIWLEPSIAVGYCPRRALAPLFRQYLSYGAGRALTTQRHHARLKARQILPLAVAPAVILAAASPAAGALAWWLTAPMLVWLTAVLAAGVVVGVRARDPWAAASGVAASTMHLAWSLGFWGQRLFGRRPGPEPTAIAPSPV